MSLASKAARGAFLLLHMEGLQLTVEGDQLVVRPASRITDDLRSLIRQHRDDLFHLASAGDGDFDPRQFPETVKILAELRRVFGPGCRLAFATEGGRAFGIPSPPGVPASGHHEATQPKGRQ